MHNLFFVSLLPLLSFLENVTANMQIMKQRNFSNRSFEAFASYYGVASYSISGSLPCKIANTTFAGLKDCNPM